MPKPPLADAAIALLQRPILAVIATVRPDGQPVSVPTWFLYEDGRILVNMDEGRRRLEYLRHDRRVSLSIVDPDDWITHVSIQGRVDEFVDDPSLTDIDRLSHRYLGKPYHNRERGRVSAWIGIDRWHGWGALTQR
ncbi:MAG TPA: PPOX class F420-dependent oxidoreductase [Nocardioidaceae bacterium]|jgi:PPOX class probable F420-dependent enzyme|nr:PPOX class F420-dependent oxidoreductase [Nocardioidaceae bacterium]